MTFREAVEKSKDPIRSAYKHGKNALKSAHQQCVRCSDTRRFVGSIDLETAYRNHGVHQDSFWDYGLGIRQGREEVALWIEVHPASTGEVNRILKKLERLLGVLETDGVPLSDLTKKRKGGKKFVWIATDAGVHINPNSSQARQLIQAGIDLPRRVIDLS